MAAVEEVYARALFGLAESSGKTADIITELKIVSSALVGDATVEAALMGGLLDSQSRTSLLESVLTKAGASDLSKRYILLLAKRARLEALSGSIVELERLLNKKSGVVAGNLAAAVELTQDEVSGIASSISKRIGARVELRQKVNPDLLGGFVAQVAGRTFDSSLRTQLEKLRTELTQ